VSLSLFESDISRTRRRSVNNSSAAVITGRVVRRVRQELHTKFGGKISRNVHLEDYEVEGRITLRRILRRVNSRNTDRGSFPVAGFDISVVDPSESTTSALLT
jgi:hypothetical protein